MGHEVVDLTTWMIASCRTREVESSIKGSRGERGEPKMEESHKVKWIIFYRHK